MTFRQGWRWALYLTHMSIKLTMCSLKIFCTIWTSIAKYEVDALLEFHCVNACFHMGKLGNGGKTSGKEFLLAPIQPLNGTFNLFVKTKVPKKRPSSLDLSAICTFHTTEDRYVWYRGYDWMGRNAPSASSLNIWAEHSFYLWFAIPQWCHWRWEAYNGGHNGAVWTKFWIQS